MCVVAAGILQFTLPHNVLQGCSWNTHVHYQRIRDKARSSSPPFESPFTGLRTVSSSCTAHTRPPVQASSSLIQPSTIYQEDHKSRSRKGMCAMRSDGRLWSFTQSTYTGVYKKGGPSTVEPSKDLSALLDRSPADVRGIKKSVIAQQGGSPLTNADSSPAASVGNALRRPPSINTSVLATPAHGSGRCVALSLLPLRLLLNLHAVSYS